MSGDKISYITDVEKTRFYVIKVGATHYSRCAVTKKKPTWHRNSKQHSDTEQALALLKMRNMQLKSEAFSAIWRWLGYNESATYQKTVIGKVLLQISPCFRTETRQTSSILEILETSIEIECFII